MLCPCGHADLDQRDFRDFLRSNREALLAARTVVRGEAFGGAVIERRGGKVYVGPDRDGPGAGPDTAAAGQPTRGAAARSPDDVPPRARGVLRRLRGILGG